MGRSFAGSKTAARSSVKTSSINSRLGRSRAQSSAADARRFPRFATTSATTYGLVCNIQPLSAARRKISRDAPDSDPLAASKTLESRKTLTCFVSCEGAAYPIHLRRSSLLLDQPKICGEREACLPVRAAELRGIKAVVASLPEGGDQSLFRCPKVCSRRKYTPESLSGTLHADVAKPLCRPKDRGRDTNPRAPQSYSSSSCGLYAAITACCTLGGVRSS